MGKKGVIKVQNPYFISINRLIRKYLIGEEMVNKGVIKVQNPYFISINRLIKK